MSDNKKKFDLYEVQKYNDPQTTKKFYEIREGNTVVAVVHDESYAWVALGGLNEFFKNKK